MSVSPSCKNLRLRNNSLRRISHHINTIATSILPYEGCCTIFTPPHPKIRPELAELLGAEAAMPGLAELEAEAAENTERIRIRITDEIEFEG